MYLRIKRERYDSLPDILVAAAAKTSAPRIQQTTGNHLEVFYISGSQLGELGEKLRQLAGESASFSSRPEAKQLLAETIVCSGLYIVSTTVEVLLISDRSSDEYELVEDQYSALMIDYVNFGEGCTFFIEALNALRAHSS